MIYKLPGFSLIEIAVVLIIIGLVGGITFPMLKTLLETQKARLTARHQEQVLYALASFAVKNKSLPYACDPLNPNGTEDKLSKRRRGILPFVDLGLPESVAKDGYSRWFTYVVDGTYAQPPKQELSGSYSPQLENRLCGKENFANPLRLKGRNSKIALAVISHGAKGRGAYPNPKDNPPQSADEHQNSTSEEEIVDREMSHDPANPFSHSVVWATAQNLLAIYAHAPCPPAKPHTPSSFNMSPSNSSDLLGK